jgi:predicted RNA-binding protein YlqC (UPF0109 family)
MTANTKEFSDMSSIDQQFVEFIVKSLVSNPDAVSIERRIDEKGVLLELTVDPEDLGRVIGKRGATAQSLRTLLRALGTKNDARYNLKIIDNGEPGAGRSSQSDDGQAPQDAAASNDDNASSTSDDDVAVSAPAPSRMQGIDDLEDSEDRVMQQPSRDGEGSSMASKTRKELAELDDLDV